MRIAKDSILKAAEIPAPRCSAKRREVDLRVSPALFSGELSPRGSTGADPLEP